MNIRFMPRQPAPPIATTDNFLVCITDDEAFINRPDQTRAYRELRDKGQRAQLVRTFVDSNDEVYWVSGVRSYNPDTDTEEVYPLTTATNAYEVMKRIRFK